MWPIQQAGRAEASRRHRRRTFQTAIPRCGRRCRHLQVSMPQRRDRRRHSLRHRVRFRAAPDRSCARRRRAFPAFSSPAPIGAPRSRTPSAASDRPAKGWRTRWRRCAPTRTQPVICALHLAAARLQFADRGKSSIILTTTRSSPMTKPRPRNIANDILDASRPRPRNGRGRRNPRSGIPAISAIARRA